jgi:hypothetical protein
LSWVKIIFIKINSGDWLKKVYSYFIDVSLENIKGEKTVQFIKKNLRYNLLLISFSKPSKIVFLRQYKSNARKESMGLEI